MAKLVSAVDTATKVEALFVPEAGKEPSLHQLAIVLGIPAVRLQSAQVAYKPVEGEPYTAKKINWANVSSFIARRLEKTGYDSVEAVYEAALEAVYTPKRATRAKNPDSVYGKILVGTTPVRKGNLEVGSKIKNRKTEEIFTVVFVDASIVCFQGETAEGEIALTKSIGNRMFNMNFDIVA